MQNLDLPFAEVRLYHKDIIEGTAGGVAFLTDITINNGGFEQRNANWEYPLGSWEIGQRGYNKDTIEYLQSFHRQRRGRYQGFRFRDMADFAASATPLPSEDGFFTQGFIVSTANPLVGQLIKRYSDGTFVADRIISKPVAGSIAGIPSGCQLNLNTGEVSSSFAINEPIAVAFEFDVPVRFDTERLHVTLESTEGDVEGGDWEAIYQIDALPIVELRMRPEL
jgi:uncharacterized protein (TIGR02217 family)